jgi:hypothetical protein
MKALARFTRVVVSYLPLALALMPLGCSNQGAGERCSRAEDCSSGLECNFRVVVGMGNQGLCCPINDPGSVPACIPKFTPIPVTDASANDADALTNDAPVESSADTSSTVDSTTSSDSDGAPATPDAETSDTSDADLTDAASE